MALEAFKIRFQVLHIGHIVFHTRQNHTSLFYLRFYERCHVVFEVFHQEINVRKAESKSFKHGDRVDCKKPF
jgi:hypothetical protein